MLPVCYGLFLFLSFFIPGPPPVSGKMEKPTILRRLPYNLQTCRFQKAPGLGEFGRWRVYRLAVGVVGDYGGEILHHQLIDGLRPQLLVGYYLCGLYRLCQQRTGTAEGGKMDINDLTYKINGAIFEVNRELGTGFLEKVYENALLIELRDRGLKAES